jgi:phage/plasmid-associated DNA primase
MTLGIRIDDLEEPPIGDEDDNAVPPQLSLIVRFGSGMATTDTAYASELFRHLKPLVLYAKHEQPEFWIYHESDRLWHKDNDLMKVVGIETAQTPLFEYIESLSDNVLSKEDKCKEAVRLSNMSGITSVFRAVQNMFEVSMTNDTALIDERMDQTRGLLPLEEGRTLELRTGRIRPRVRGDYFSKFCPFTPVELTQDHRAWINNYFTELLRVVDADGTTIKDPSAKHVLFLQYCLAYVLTGEVNAAVWFQFTGIGANGKSVLLAILLMCLGPFGVAGSTRAWTVKAGQEPACHDAERIQLIGTRLCVLAEIAEQSFFDAEFLKKTAAGDMQVFRECHGSSKSMIYNKLTCVAIAATNHIVRFQKIDPAFIRRMCCFHFGNVFKQGDAKKLQEIMSMAPMIFTSLCEVATQVYQRETEFMILFDERSDEVKAFTEQVVTNQNPVWQWLAHHGVQNIGTDGVYEVNLDTTLFCMEAWDSFKQFHAELRCKMKESVPNVSQSEFNQLVSQRMKFAKAVQRSGKRPSAEGAEVNDRRQYWPRSRWIENPADA